MNNYCEKDIKYTIKRIEVATLFIFTVDPLNVENESSKGMRKILKDLGYKLNKEYWKGNVYPEQFILSTNKNYTDKIKKKMINDVKNINENIDLNKTKEENLKICNLINSPEEHLLDNIL